VISAFATRMSKYFNKVFSSFQIFLMKQNIYKLREFFSSFVYETEKREDEHFYFVVWEGQLQNILRLSYDQKIELTYVNWKILT
jgi:hypothetical protein